MPAAFAYATGRVHWKVLLQARAIENHAYVVAPHRRATRAATLSGATA